MKKDSPISKEEFLKALDEGKKCYLKKPRSWQRVWYWWEIDKKDPDERWFMNIYRSEKKGDNDFSNSSWITAKDLDMWLSHAEREGYKYYTNE
jgi:hypothetical protein